MSDRPSPQAVVSKTLLGKSGQPAKATGIRNPIETYRLFLNNLPSAFSSDDIEEIYLFYCVPLPAPGPSPWVAGTRHRLCSPG